MSRKNRRQNQQPQTPPVAPIQNTMGSIEESESFKNGLGEALGRNAFSGLGNFGLPGQFNPWSEQVSNSGTLFKNLRWYLVSNFRQLLSQLYVEIGLVQTVVDVPVDDGLRGGVKFKSKQLDESQIRELQISFDRDDDLNTAGFAAKWARLYGGAGILVLTDQDPEEPLDIEAIGPDTPLEFRAVDMWELFWDKQNTEGYDPSIQTEDFEFYNYYAMDVHKSRVMRIKGLTPPSFIRPRLRGWGFSVVEVLVRSINQYLKSTDLGFEVLDEFKLDVYKIKNLVNTLLSPNGQQKIQQRVQLANWQKNYQNAVVMDSEDDFDHKQLSFAGLAEAMTGIRMQVAADMRMPITKLFGTSVSAGFSTDQNDMENYNSMVEAQVRNKLKYDLLRIAEIKCQKIFGFIPDDLELEFKPLRELTAVDEENVKTQKFNRLSMAKEKGEISTQEYRDACNKGNLFDVQLDTTEDRLNPNDPEVAEIVSEGAKRAPLDITDVDDPGANREDTRKPRAWDVIRTRESSDRVKIGNEIWTFNQWDRMKRFFNSAEFDRASYEADGGDAWIDPALRPLFENPGNVDEALWSKAKEASMKAYGKVKWQFVTWFYKKQGGKFT
jgi:phage-related protein (TIGR01555 family)